MIYLSKYMAGIVGIAKEVMDRESTGDLRMDLEYKDEVTNKIITDGRTTDLAEKKQITDSITTLDTKTDDFRAHYDDF